jgi:hypothetical protein
MGVLIGLLIALFGPAYQSVTSADADDVLAELSKIHIDKKQIYNIRDITIRRDAISIAFNRGVIAFVAPVKGKVTGAVFVGSGEIVVIPADGIEKQQVYKFTGTPLLNETFQAGVFRFTDSTYDDLKREISQHAAEDVSLEDAAQFDSWDGVLADRGKALTPRLLADLLEPAKAPLFLGELKGDRTGWFNVLFDLRSPEEVSLFQARDLGNVHFVDTWASFNQRNESRNPEAVAHENKSAIDIDSYDIEARVGPERKLELKTVVRAKGRVEGARVLNFDIPPSQRLVSVVADTDAQLPLYQSASMTTAILPSPIKLGQEITLRFSYSGTTDVARTISNDDGPGRMRDYFSGILGPYPYSHLLVVQSTQNELQNWPTVVEIPASTDSNATELVLAREIARQWFGQRVMPASYHDQWLFDGLAGYVAAMYADTQDPAHARLTKILDEARLQLKPVESAGPISLGRRLVSSKSPSGYSAVYNKALWVIHMLRMMLRQDTANPDGQFLGVLKEFADTYGGKTASTWDFQHLVEKHLPASMDLRDDKKLDWFFDQWVFGMGLPEYALDYKILQADGGFVVRGTIKESEVPDGFIMSVPIYADDQYLGSVTVSDTEGEFRFGLRGKPERLIIDPQGTILRQVRQ